MKKILGLLLCLSVISFPAMAGENVEATLSALAVTAFATAVVHTIAGPDHYLPFIAIAKSRGYSLKKTLMWTLFCGVGHIGSALLIALAFIYFSQYLSEAGFIWIEDNRADLAAYALIGLGGAYVLWALRHRFLHKHGHSHQHISDNVAGQKSIAVWVVFIIFVLGPCEALLPILTASSVLGVSAVISNTLIFSAATIVTMMLAVAFGVLGIGALRFQRLEKYAHEIAGCTIMACGIAIICGL